MEDRAIAAGGTHWAAKRSNWSAQYASRSNGSGVEGTPIVVEAMIRIDKAPASEPPASYATQSSWLASRLSPGDAGILAAFAASVSALIVIWGVALGYIRF